MHRFRLLKFHVIIRKIRVITSIFTATVLYFPAAVLCFPAAVLCFPAAVLCFPEAVLCLPAAVLYFPATVLCFPAAVLCFPAAVLFFPAAVLCFPAAVLFFPATVLSFPAAVLCFPATVLCFPAAVLFFPATVLNLQVITGKRHKDVLSVRTIRKNGIKNNFFSREAMLGVYETGDVSGKTGAMPSDRARSTGLQERKVAGGIVAGMSAAAIRVSGVRASSRLVTRIQCINSGCQLFILHMGQFKLSRPSSRRIRCFSAERRKK
jgi:hypothetical protein